MITISHFKERIYLYYTAMLFFLLSYGFSAVPSAKHRWGKQLNLLSRSEHILPAPCFPFPWGTRDGLSREAGGGGGGGGEGLSWEG